MSYRQKGLHKGYVFEWNIGQNPQKRRCPFLTKGKRMSIKMYHGVMIWSLLVFPCLSFCFLSCFHAFPVTVSVGFLSAFDSFPPFLSFFLLLHLHSCLASVFPLAFLSACKLNSLSSFLHFHPAVALFRLVLRSGTKPKRRQKRRPNSRQAAWHGPSQELASLLPHPATTATTATATAGPSYASAAGFCLTTTSKAPTPPPSL